MSNTACSKPYGKHMGISLFLNLTTDLHEIRLPWVMPSAATNVNKYRKQHNVHFSCHKEALL